MADISMTQFFDSESSRQMEVGDILRQVYQALTRKGYNPVNQIVGYIMSGDPTYITSYENARSLIMRVERDELLEELVKFYVDHKLEDRSV
ncbi:MAG: IreB family regulatory phosphoprotein [Lachnospiraceae bacterium]|nr:IreB family regulatory phosphoprotein [Lachnospiraceae bacterium]MBQ1399770.1 IreB family regulatory phosphoprotein [Lachnospiraceae bacterium]MBQ1516435.1 IreB family regulatory phosphoprotein [Lachnospiraceae bacterium]MBQ4309180.1 IreB family regulatory phosphoprotein [Lachnospiraceae bacterium]MBQ9464896.1 IreB family regulatory phosphoprotein [Lachnospiraceae bacterium]